MRFSLAAFTVAVAAASASATLLPRQSLPTCANSCISNPNIGSCSGPADTVCLCNSSAFVTSTTQCIQGACSGSDLQAAQAAAVAICQAAGVNLSTVAPASSAASGASSAASAASSAASGAASAGSSAASAASSAIASVTGSSPAASATGNSASTTSANAVAGLIAFGLAALAL